MTMKWGVLSTAKIAREKVLPAINQAEGHRVVAVASRNLDKAQELASAIGAEHAHGSYEALLENSDVDAIYIPTPNHLHISQSIAALQAGKHVLCEKPAAIEAQDLAPLAAELAKEKGLLWREAFMYRFHPRWKILRDLISADDSGPIRHIHSVFCFHNKDEKNVRNSKEYGGGALLDVGCYCISSSRWLFESEPVSIFAQHQVDPNFGVDGQTSGMLNFRSGTATFNCATQLDQGHSIEVQTEFKRFYIERPFHLDPANTDSEIQVYTTEGLEKVHVPYANQYVLMVEDFGRAISQAQFDSTQFEETVRNAETIDAVRQSAELGQVIAFED